MRCTLALLCLLGAALADKAAFEAELEKEGVDLQALHATIKEISREVEEEEGGEDYQKQAQDLLNKYFKSFGNVTWSEEVSPNDVNDASGAAEDLFEGDMRLTGAQAKAALIVDGRTRRQALAEVTRMWTKNSQGLVRIPYSYENGFPASRKPFIEAAARFWKENTCIQMDPASLSNKNQVEIVSREGCYSNVGMQRGRQEISIANNCDYVGTVAHEMSHTFGTMHVQSRSDRDNYVRIVEGNIKPGMVHNFYKENHEEMRKYFGEFTNYGIPYEFTSVMHYHPLSFSTSQQPTIVALPPYQAYQDAMGAPLPTFYDRLLVNTMYNCSQRCTRSVPCANGGVVNPSTCSTCICPTGYKGATCSEPAGRVITVTSTPQKFSLMLGTSNRWGEKSLSMDEHTFIFEASKPNGKIRFTPLWSEGNAYAPTTAACSFAGLEVIGSKDKRMAGQRVCNPSINRIITSEDNKMIIWAYRNAYMLNVAFTVQEV